MELPDQEKDIINKEYGRNIQNIVEYILKIEDRDMRSRYAVTCIELMRQINPLIKDTQEHYSKLWDQLYIISNFQLDVDSPYPMPERSAIGKKPMQVAYNSNNLYYKHYGKNLELIIEKAIKLEDPEEKEAAIIYLGKTMKRFYATWNKENVDDEVIVQHMKEMSKNKLQVDLEKVKAQGLFDSNEKIKPQNLQGGNNYNSISYNSSSSGSGGSNNRYKNNNSKNRNGGNNGKYKRK